MDVQGRLIVPSFDLAWLQFSNKSSYLLVPGGGGSTKSGVKNVIQIFKISEKLDFQSCQNYSTDTDSLSCLCSAISIGVIKGEICVCVCYDRSCAILVASGSGEDLHLERVVDFEADFVDGGSVNCCCILPTGHLVTGGDDASIRVWDFDIGDNGWRAHKQAELRGHSGPIMSLGFHPTDRLLCSGSKDGTCKVWNLANELMIGDIICIDGIESKSAASSGAAGKIECRGCRFSGDGFSIYLIQCARRGSTCLVKWDMRPMSDPIGQGMPDASNGKHLKKGNPSKDFVPEITSLELVPSKVAVVAPVPSTRLCLSDCGDFVAVGVADGSVVVFDMKSFKKVMSRSSHDLPVTGLGFAPVSVALAAGVPDILVSCSADNKIYAIPLGGLSQLFRLSFILMSIVFVGLLFLLTYLLFYDKNAAMVLQQLVDEWNTWVPMIKNVLKLRQK